MSFTDWPVSWALINESDALLTAHRNQKRKRVKPRAGERAEVEGRTQISFVSALRLSGQEVTHAKHRSWENAHSALFKTTPEQKDGYTHFLSVAERRSKCLPPARVRPNEYVGPRPYEKPPTPPPLVQRWEALPDGRIVERMDGVRDEHGIVHRSQRTLEDEVPDGGGEWKPGSPARWPQGPLPDPDLEPERSAATVVNGRLPIHPSISAPSLIRAPAPVIDPCGSDYFQRPAHTSDAHNYLGYIAARSNPYRRSPHHIAPNHKHIDPAKRQWWARGMAQRQLHNISLPYKRCLRAPSSSQAPQGVDRRRSMGWAPGTSYEPVWDSHHSTQDAHFQDIEVNMFDGRHQHL